MNQALGGARSDDCGSLREDGIAYVSLEISPTILTPAIPVKSPKAANRGFHHPILGRLLCPIKYINEFDADPAT